MKKEVCETCKWKDGGACHLLPPVVITVGNSHELYAETFCPKVVKGDFCSKWEKA